MVEKEIKFQQYLRYQEIAKSHMLRAEAFKEVDRQDLVAKEYELAKEYLDKAVSYLKEAAELSGNL